MLQSICESQSNLQYLRSSEKVSSKLSCRSTTNFVIILHHITLKLQKVYPDVFLYMKEGTKEMYTLVMSFLHLFERCRRLSFPEFVRVRVLSELLFELHHFSCWDKVCTRFGLHSSKWNMQIALSYLNHSSVLQSAQCTCAHVKFCHPILCSFSFYLSYERVNLIWHLIYSFLSAWRKVNVFAQVLSLH